MNLESELDDAVEPGAPIWAVFGDLMAALLGAFVLILVFALGMQFDLAEKLKNEVRQREAETQRREALERALAIPLAAGRVTLANGRIGISGSVLFAFNSAELQPEGRQLENLCHWLTVMAPGQQVEIGDLPAELREVVPTTLATDWETGLEGEVDRMLASGIGDIHGRLSQVFERILISRALARTGGRRIEAAQALGIGRNTITRKIAELGIDGSKEHAAE